MREESKHITIEPALAQSLLELLAGLGQINHGICPIDDPDPEPVDI